MDSSTQYPDFIHRSKEQSLYKKSDTQGHLRSMIIVLSIKKGLSLT